MRLKSAELAGSTITLKLKTADFRPRTRAQSLNAPTQLADRIFSTARELLAKEVDGTQFRLIGTGVSALRCADTADTDLLNHRHAAAERTMDALRSRFGRDAVIKGIAYDGPERSE